MTYEVVSFLALVLFIGTMCARCVLHFKSQGATKQAVKVAGEWKVVAEEWKCAASEWQKAAEGWKTAYELEAEKKR